MNNPQRFLLLPAALILFGAAQAFAAPAAPTLLFPEDLRVSSNKTPTFDWSDVGASTYTLQIATASDFTTVTISSTGMQSSSYTVTVGQALTRGSTYYWRVRSSDGTGNGVFASTQSFHVSFNRIAYTLDVDTSTPFSTPITVTQQIVASNFITPTTNQFTLTPGQALAGGTTYYWRVKATDNAGNASAYSNPDSKIVIGVFPSPVLTAPADQKRLITTTPLLSWGSVPGATSYTVSVSTYPDFSLIYFSPPSQGGTQYQVQPTDNLQNLTTYYWSVSATDAGGDISVSTRTFYVETVSTSTLIFPEDVRLTSSKRPSFQWGVPGGPSFIRDLTFTLEWATNQNMTGLQAQPGISTDNYTLNGVQALNRGTTYYWRVKTIDNDGTTLIASTRSFNVSFNRIAYTLDVDTSTPFSTPITVTQQIVAPNFITPTTNQFTLTPGQTLAGGTTYYWRVKATDNAGNASAYSSPDSKIVIGVFPSPVLTAPADQKRLITKTPLLSWGSVAGATSYTVSVSTYPDFSLIYFSPPSQGGTQYQVQPTDNLQNLTTYYWSVSATDAGGDISVSTRTFYVETVSTSTLIFPDDLRLTSNRKPSFQWGVPGGPSFIRDLTFTLEWATNQNMTGLQAQPGISTDNYTLNGVQALNRGTTYYWRVKTVDNDGTTLIASTRSFNVSFNRIAYTLDLDTSTPFSTPITVTQQIVAPNFITPTTNQFTLTPGQTLTNATTYYWRVKATDNAGNASAYSNPDSKIVIGVFPSPVLTAPADQKRLITTTPLLSWGSVPGATSYTVSVSTYPDFSLIYFSPAGQAGTQYQVQPTDNLQNLTTYYWSVSATDAGGDISVSTRTFYVETVSTSTLIFPDDLRLTSNRKPSFQWGVPGGPSFIRDLTFTLEWATNQNMTGLQAQPGISTDNYTLNGVQALNRGTTYYWRVKTVDNDGTTLIASTRSFNVSFNRIAYTLDLDTSTPFSTPITVTQQIVAPNFITPTTNQFTLTPGQTLTNATTYYWRVKATDNAGNASAYSNPDSKIVIGVFPSPVLTAPADQKRLITTTPLLSWGSVPGATSYTVSVSTYPDFSLIYFSPAGQAGTQYQVQPTDNLQNLTTYYWSVSATDAGGDISVSTRTFYVETVSTSTLIFPDDLRLTSNRKPSFQWSVPGGPSGIRDLSFKLEWATNQNMTGALAQSLISTDNYTLAGGQALSRGTTYYWRIKTVDNDGTNLIASTRSFVVSSNTITYTLELDTKTPVALPGQYFSSRTMTTATYGLAPAESLAAGTTSYYWHVKATDWAGNSSVSVDGHFDVVVACPVTRTVCGSGCFYGTIQSALNSFGSSLTGYSCVLIQDAATYPEQVTVQNFANAGSSLTIMADPSLGLTPIISPPASSTAAFVIKQASVNVIGINIVPTNAMTYGVFASSAYVTLSSVNVQDALGKISLAGVALSSWNFVSFSSVTVGGVSADAYYLPGSTRTTISYSTAQANGSGVGLSLDLGASSNTITQSFIANSLGDAATINSDSNTISFSTMNAGGGSNALFINGASFNTVASSYLSGMYGFHTSGGSSNTVTQSNLIAVYPVYFAAGHSNVVSFSTMTGSSIGFYTVNSLSNSVSQSFMTGGAGQAGAMFDAGSAYNSISFSTMTTNVAGSPGLAINASSSNTVTSSYIAGSTAAFITGSTNTVIGGCVMIATSPAGSALAVSAGSFGITLSSSVLQGGAQGAGVYLDLNNRGFIVLSTNTVLAGSKYGFFIPHQQAGTQIWITSNTVLGTLSNTGDTFGLYLNGLTTGATIQNNGVYYRTPGSQAGFTAYPLFAQSAGNLNIDHNRFSNPGMINAGSFGGVALNNSPHVQFKFNDVNSTGTAFTNHFLLQFNNGSTGGIVKDSIFMSSAITAGSADVISVDAASQAGFASDYNDFFSSNTLSFFFNGTGYGTLAAWQAASLQDTNSKSNHPLWANPSAGSEDFHPLSIHGRCSTPLPYNLATVPLPCAAYTVDAAHSKTIDAGDPAESFALEPLPAGRAVNLGSYGNTAEASESRRKLQVINIR